MKIEKLPSGNYRIRVVIGHDNAGKPIRKSFTHHDKTRLRRIAAEYADEHRNVTTRQTVGSAIDAFMVEKAPVLSPSTMLAYTSMVKVLKTEYRSFCALSLSSVGQKELQMFINSRVKAGNSPKTIRNYHAFLSAVFKNAKYDFPKVTLPQKIKPKISIPDDEAIKTFMENASDSNVVALTLALYGMRRSEICALTPEDLNGNWIHVCKAVVRGPDNQWHTKTTKNPTSDRMVLIPQKVADQIREQGYVTKLSPSGLSKAFDRLLEKSGVSHHRLHDLRHYFVSYCYNDLGLTDVQIEKITGHKNERVLRDNYLHSRHDQQVAQMVSDSISNLIG